MPNADETWKHTFTGDLVKVTKINGAYVYVMAVSAARAWWVPLELFARGSFTLA